MGSMVGGSLGGVCLDHTFPLFLGIVNLCCDSEDVRRGL